MKRKIFLLLILIVMLSLSAHTVVYADLFDDQGQVEADAGMTWAEIMEMSQQSSSGLAPTQGLVLWMFAMLAFLKLAQKIDNMLQQLGLNVVQTGGRVASDLLMAGFAISKIGGMASRFAGAAGGASGSSGSRGSGSGGSGGAGRTSGSTGQNHPPVPSSPSPGRTSLNPSGSNPPGGSSPSGGNPSGRTSGASPGSRSTASSTPSADTSSERRTSYDGTADGSPPTEDNNRREYLKGLGRAAYQRGAIGAGAYLGKSAYRGVSDAIAKRRETASAERTSNPADKPADTSSKPLRTPVSSPVNYDEKIPATPQDSNRPKPPDASQPPTAQQDWLPAQPPVPASYTHADMASRDGASADVDKANDESFWTPAEPPTQPYDYHMDSAPIPSSPGESGAESSVNSGDDWTQAAQPDNAETIQIPAPDAIPSSPPPQSDIEISIPVQPSDVKTSELSDGVESGSTDGWHKSSDSKPAMPMPDPSTPPPSPASQTTQSADNQGSETTTKADAPQTPVRGKDAVAQPPQFISASQPAQPTQVSAPPVISASPPQAVVQPAAEQPQTYKSTPPTTAHSQPAWRPSGAANPPPAPQVETTGQPLDTALKPEHRTRRTWRNPGSKPK